MKYSREPESAVKSSKTRATALRVHYQHMREIAHLIMGMKLTKAKSYLEDVLEYKQIVPVTKYTGGVGRHAQAKNRKVRMHSDWKLYRNLPHRLVFCRLLVARVGGRRRRLRLCSLCSRTRRQMQR